MKFLLLGDPAVGKTALVGRFVHQRFDFQYKATLGLDLSSKDVKLGDRLVRIQLWDIASQKSFEKMRSSFYKGARGALIVFDVTRPTTFKNLDYWLNELQQHTNNAFFTALYGNALSTPASKIFFASLYIISPFSGMVFTSFSVSLPRSRLYAPRPLLSPHSSCPTAALS